LDLVGRLSNHDLTDLLQSLTAQDWKQDRPRLHRPKRGVAPDGRRRFGAVRDAIVAVLEAAPGELRAREIHARVEELLGEPVSRGSVKSYLRVGCHRKRPLFEYCGRQGYRLATATILTHPPDD
jgi:hypothetical protein